MTGVEPAAEGPERGPGRIDLGEQAVHRLGARKQPPSGWGRSPCSDSAQCRSASSSAGRGPQCWTADRSPKRRAAATASTKVDLPEPFSPTMTVTRGSRSTPAARSAAIAGTSKYQARGLRTRLSSISTRFRMAIGGHAIGLIRQAGCAYGDACPRLACQRLAASSRLPGLSKAAALSRPAIDQRPLADPGSDACGGSSRIVAVAGDEMPRGDVGCGELPVHLLGRWQVGEPMAGAAPTSNSPATAATRRSASPRGPSRPGTRRRTKGRSPRRRRPDTRR